jgi:hypothetical protein
LDYNPKSFVSGYPTNLSKLISTLNNTKGLTYVGRIGQRAIYEVKDPYPLIYATSIPMELNQSIYSFPNDIPRILSNSVVNYSVISPVSYEVNIQNATKPFILARARSWYTKTKTNSMSILVINNRPTLSGIGRYAEQLICSLREMDISVDYLNWNSEIIEELFRKAMQLNNKALLYSEEALRIVSQVLFTFKVRKGYDLYHIATPALTFIVVTRRPAVVTIHDLVPYAEPRSITDILIRKSIGLVKRAHCIICVSESTRSDLLRFMDVDPKKVRVVYYGVDHELFRPRDRLEARRKLGLPLNGQLILNVGSEEPRKNIPTLLKSFKRLLKDVPDALLIRVDERTARVEEAHKDFRFEWQGVTS